MKNVAIFGATGSIGINALKVIDDLNQNFSVHTLTGNTNISLLLEQTLKFHPKNIILVTAEHRATFEGLLKAKKPDWDINITSGLESMAQIASSDEVDIVVNAVSGAAGLPISYSALKAGKRLALANKESLVIAGDNLLPLIKEFGGSIIPIDSEHSAIFQAMQAGQGEEIEKIIITASGGPFWERAESELEEITPEEALKHPKWDMGKKISIDSATMMNKALEIIEAHYLFGLSEEKIKVVIHPQAIIHSMVEFQDGSVIAQMGVPDMRIPIQYALTYPARVKADLPKMNFSNMHKLDLIPPDLNRFSAIELGYRVVREGGTLGAVLNAANEIAVEMFLAGEISFNDIVRRVRGVMDRHDIIKEPEMDDILQSDDWARMEVKKC